MAFCNPCLRSTDVSFLHQSNSIKSLFRRQLKKCRATGRFQRLKRSNLVRERNFVSEIPSIVDATTNYDMTVFHDEALDETEVALSRRRSKKIPRWARKSQIQLAIINQLYYQNQNPEEIFGRVEIARAREMVASIELWNSELPFVYSADLPPNFV